MKTELNKKNNQTTVVIDVSYEVENNVARDFVRDEHATVFYDLKDDGILRFEWYLNEEDKTGTLIEVFENSGWHFHNILSAEEISIKLKSFAHTEFSGKFFSSPDIINKKINQRVDLYNRGHKYEKNKMLL